jgi:hypothetical protein
MRSLQAKSVSPHRIELGNVFSYYDLDAKVIGTSGVVNPTNMKFDFGEGDKGKSARVCNLPRLISTTEATHFGRVLPARRTDSPSNSGYN